MTNAIGRCGRGACAVLLAMVAGGIGGCGDETDRSSQGPTGPTGGPSAAGQEGWEAFSLVLPKAGPITTPKDTPKNVRLRPNLPARPFRAPKGTTNVARGKPVTGSDPFPVIGDLPLVTDGDKEPRDGSFVELGPGRQWVRIDLGAPHRIYAVAVWHSHTDTPIYRDVIVQVAGDPDFTGSVQTVFNNDYDNSSELGAGEDLEYYETRNGELIDIPRRREARGAEPLFAEGRYVRLHSNGNTTDDLNRYTEVEVYGIPVP